MRRIAGAVLVAVMASGCDTYHYLSGTIHEDARRPVKAIAHYETFLASRPKDPRSCEMRLRAAEIYRSVFYRYEDARRHYEAAARDFPKMKDCVDLAKAGLLRCPDYFPLEPGRTWVYVDSETKGRSMRLDWDLRKSLGTHGGVITTALYAGNRRIREGSETYRKEEWAVWRVDGAAREPILRYPYAAGQSWKASRLTGKEKSVVEWQVVSVSEAVKVAAGDFKDCLKVREHDLRFASTWRYDYYCPGVGRVKTTIAGPGFENPNTELSRSGRID